MKHILVSLLALVYATQAPANGLSGLILKGVVSSSYSNTYSMLFGGGATNEVVSNFSDQFNRERTDGFSVSCWFKKTATGVYQMVIGNNVSGSAYRGWSLVVQDDDQIQWDLLNGYPDNWAQVVTSASVSSNVFVHVVGTKASGSSAASSMKVYINRSAAATTTGSDSLSATTVGTDPLRIGGRAADGNNFFGNIDECSLWNSELTPSEVSALADVNGKPANLAAHPAYANLAHWWRMGDAPDSITQIRDRRGTNHGTPIDMEAGDIDPVVP